MTQGSNTRNQKRRKSSKTTVQHASKKTVQKVQKPLAYDVQAKSWRGPVNESEERLQIIKSIQEKHKQREQQQPETLKHDRQKVLEHVEPPSVAEETDEDEDDLVEKTSEDEEACSVAQDASAEPPNIAKPFQMSEKGNAIWSMPHMKSPRPKEKFEWEKPTSVKFTKAALNSPIYQVQKLEGELSKKEEENGILRKQLLGAHRENMKLVSELQLCSGEKYDDVVRENVRLRATVDRLTKQMARSWGQSRQDGNTTLRRLERGEALERKHRSDHISPRR